MTSHRQRSKWLALTAAAVLLLVGSAYCFGWFDSLQSQLTDRFLTPKSAPSDIIIIDIDESSLAEIGQWPWSRDIHAELLNKIVSAKVVGFDVIFSEPSGDAEMDAAFAVSIVNFDGLVVLPQVIDEQSGMVRDPIEVLSSVSDLGFVNTKTDRDGIVRRVELNRKEKLSFDQQLSFLDKKTIYNDSFFISYYGPAKTFTTISYIDVLNGKIPLSIFADKTLLVGASAAGLGDIFQTPFGAMSGVEIHANTIATMRAGIEVESISKVTGLINLTLIAIILFLITRFVQVLVKIYGALILSLVAIVLGAQLMFSLGYIVPHLYQIILFVLLTGALLLLQYIFELNEKRFIRRGFEQYVAPSVVAEIADHPEKLVLGGEERKLTILFSDIRGFTTISEQLTPSALMDQLNEYLEEMSEAVMERQGLVDKYIGDAVMAFWGAPLSDTTHEVHACESAIAMMRALEELNERWVKAGKPEFKIGIGISTGDVVVGNMGSRRRFNYSIIGDEVNFSARIEGLTKQYGVYCLIGENTHQAIKDLPHLVTRELDDVMVKGKIEPRRIYELLTSEITETKKLVLEHFAAGRAAYCAGDFKVAIDAFTSALAQDSKDGPSQVFLDRSVALLENPPENWTGVFEFKTK